jgi:hypothetical protein
MKKALVLLILFICVSGFSQDQILNIPPHLKNTSLAGLQSGDSLTYFQCHVAEASQQLVTTSGETIQGKVQKYTITEKFVVIRDKNQYRLRYFTSSLNDFPNKKFAYLKLVEKSYWNFKLEKEGILNEHDILMFAAIEDKSHDTTEYDFKITKYSTNEIIINGKKVMKQLVVEGNYLLKKNLEILN